MTGDITWKFESLQQMGAFFAKKGADIRGRIRPDTTAGSKRTMQAEAHAWEQAADIVSHSIISTAAERARLSELADAELAGWIARVKELEAEVDRLTPRDEVAS